MSIVYYPEQILSTPSKEVDFNQTSKEYLQQLYEKLCSHMIEYEGIGIAANQIGVSHKACVIYLDNKATNKFLYLINPAIVRQGKDKIKMIEGCLSFPQIKIEKNRPNIVTVKYQDINGQNLEIVLKGISSICAQHEIDHLNGITFVDDLDLEGKKKIIESLSNQIKLNTVSEIKTSIKPKI